MSLKEILTPERIKQAFEKTMQEVDIKNGKLAIITEEHYDKVKAFFDEELLQDEPTCKVLGVGMNTTMQELVMHYMAQNMSLMLVHPINGEIMGVRVMGLATDDESIFSMDDIEDLPMKTLMEVWKHCDDRAEYFKYYKTKEIVNFFGLGVGRKYRKQGVATQLMEATLCFIKNFGVSPIHIKGGASSKYSANIYDKLEYELLDEALYADYIIDGKQVICNTGEHTSLRSYGKVL